MFSPTLESDFGRKAFVDNILIAYDQYHLDGIDIDWEYPGQPGDPRNYVDANDTANFLEFLKLLRTTLPPTARISAAVQTAPFADANGYPMSDVRAFADVLDWVVIMNYDTWGGEWYLASSFRIDVPQTRLQLHLTLDRTHPLTTPAEILRNGWLVPPLR